MKMIAVAVVTAALVTGPVAAQTRPAFEFRGDTTANVRTDLATRRECEAEENAVTCSQTVQLGDVRDAIVITSYHNDRMYSVVGAVRSESYVTLLRAFIAKYGEPTLTTEPWQNRAGATFQNDVATWRFSDGTLSFKRMGSSRDWSDFEFTDPSNMPPAPEPTVNF